MRTASIVAAIGMLVPLVIGCGGGAADEGEPEVTQTIQELAAGKALASRHRQLLDGTDAYGVVFLRIERIDDYTNSVDWSMLIEDPGSTPLAVGDKVCGYQGTHAYRSVPGYEVTERFITVECVDTDNTCAGAAQGTCKQFVNSGSSANIGERITVWERCYDADNPDRCPPADTPNVPAPIWEGGVSYQLYICEDTGSYHAGCADPDPVYFPPKS